MSLEALPAPPSLPNADDPATLTGVTYFRAAPDPEDALAKALVAADARKAAADALPPLAFRASGAK